MTTNSLWFHGQKTWGVLVNNKLTWDLNISSVVAKENKTLRFLRRHFSWASGVASRT
jgi:hypothetical protein